MKLYELYIILSPNLKEEEVNNMSSGIVAELDKNGFAVVSSQIHQNERLTYKIKNFRQAHILDIEVSGPEEKTIPENITANLLRNENVLRHFIYSKAEKTIGKSKPFPNFEQIRTVHRERKSPVSVEVPASATPHQETQKVDIEEVDKKLEEILK